MPSPYQTALDELAGTFKQLNGSDVDQALELIARANKIVVFGCGRERLQMMGFAMRLFHMGLAASVAGNMTTPPIGKGDLFIASVGPGDLSTVQALLAVAKKAGATTLILTAQPNGPAGALADFILTIPAQTMADDQGANKRSVLPMGSLFEGALFILFEVMVLRLKETLSISAEAMRGRHESMKCNA
jgi:6-phospho-3-hexuloisomerase